MNNILRPLFVAFLGIVAASELLSLSIGCARGRDCVMSPSSVTFTIGIAESSSSAAGADECEKFAGLTVGAGNPIVKSARSQIGVTVLYEPSYMGLDYPMGDVPQDRGVCTDVVIRALRDSLNFDLQKAIHEDMVLFFAEYPGIWGLKKPDPNIDHRRVPNMATFFTRMGWNLPVSDCPQDYLPGDLVTSMVEGKLPHIMIVSDRKGRSGAPLVIHNIGAGTVEEDRLFEFPLTGHYRVVLEEHVQR